MNQIMPPFPPSSDVDTLTPLIWTVFGEKALEKVVKVKWDYKVKALIQKH